jgi:hypothetical protein
MEELREIDLSFSELLHLFIHCMAAEKGSEEQAQKAYYFNNLLNVFFDKYANTSLADIARGIVELGVPEDQAMMDLVYVRGFGSEDEEE